MRRWRRSGGPALRYAVSKVFRLVDDFTAAPPLYPFAFVLEELRGPGQNWNVVDIKQARRSGAFLAYAGLGLAVDPVALPARRYRLRFVDEPPRAIYRPFFQATLGALEFDVPTYNHTTPPAAEADPAELLVLLPGAAYPFPRHLPVLHGTVCDSAGPVANVRVEVSNDRVLSDANGAFSLPLRLTAVSEFVLVVAEHLPSGRSTSETVPLPGGLGRAIELELA
jgi:hypothetical protein